MRLAISNIAWRQTEDDGIAARLISAGAQALEVAPTRLHSDPAKVSVAETASIRALWEGRGLPIVSMQSLLFGAPELTLFGPKDAGEAMIERLAAVLAFAGRLGCRRAVFGSPLNRLKGARTFNEALVESAPIFRRIGIHAAAAECTFCIEANATGYGCDFITKLKEAAELVEVVADPYIGLVVDAGNMEMAGDDIDDLKHVAHLARHLHLSRARLVPLDGTAVLARRVLRTLCGAGYDGIVTIEMRAPQGTENGVDAACRAVETVRGWLDA